MSEQQGQGENSEQISRAAHLAEYQFRPGASGNPKGRPKKARDLEAMALKRCPAAIRRLTELMSSDNDKVALGACIALLDRGMGKCRSNDEGRLVKLLEERLQQMLAEAEAERAKEPPLLEGQTP